MKCAEYTAVEAGFQTTVFPTMAGAVGRLPPMEVKLKGVTAKTKPSSGRASIWFQVPGEEIVALVEHRFGDVAVRIHHHGIAMQRGALRRNRRGF